MGRMFVENKSFNSSPTEDQLRNVFKKFDTNNDNRLSQEELKKAFEYLGSNIPSFRANRALHLIDANNDGFLNEEEMDELVKYALRFGFTVKDAEPFRSSSVMPRRDGHDKYYGDSFTKADANNANGDRSSSVMPRRDGHDKYYGDSFTKADSNNANGDSSIQAIINPNADSFIQDNNANGDGLNIKAQATDERFINEEEINERAKYAARYGFTTSFGFLTKEQLMEKFKQCDVNNVRQLSRTELKKRFQYFNNEELNKLVEHAPKLGFTV